MNPAARFDAVMRYQPVDHIPDLEAHYWAEAFADWPGGACGRPNPDRTEFDRFFGLDRIAAAPVNFMLSTPPGMPRIADRDGHEYLLDHNRILSRRPHGSDKPLQHAEYLVQDDSTWERVFLPMLNPDDESRIPSDLEERTRSISANGDIPILFVGSLFAQPRNWLGCERFCVMAHTEPCFIERVLDDLTGLICSLLSKVLPRIAGDVVALHFWEDVCFSGGPLVSPESFRALWTPRYRQITDLARRHGIETVSVDCEGDVSSLVDAWLDGGVNTLSPLEQHDGCDPVELRRRYGRDLRLMGGIDSAKLSHDSRELRHALEHVAHLAAEGGYIPFCDSRYPPMVTFETYNHYLQLKREVFGISRTVGHEHSLDGIIESLTR